MKHKSALWTILCFLTFLYPYTYLHGSDTERQSEKAVLALDTVRGNALVERNFTTLERLLGNDLSYVHASGVLESKTEFIDALKSNNRRYMSIQNSDERVRVENSLAIITARSQVRVVHEGKESDLSLRVTEVYSKRKGGWQLIAYQSTRMTP